MKGFKNFSAPVHAIAPMSSALIPLETVCQSRMQVSKLNPTHGIATIVFTRLPGSFSSWSWGAHIDTSVRTSCFGETRSAHSTMAPRIVFVALAARRALCEMAARMR